MQIHVEHLCKRFQLNWIFKDIQFEFLVPKIYGIAGPNGSGKSTLLQILAGLIPPSKGKVIYKVEGALVPEDEWYKFISYAAPYAEVYDYLTVTELLKHHQNFRSFYKDINTENFIKLSYLQGHEQKWIKSFSSGMKQRLRLALAILTESKVLFLDEPLTNLDEQAIEWYQNLLTRFAKDRLVIIASNDREDFAYVNEVLDLRSFNLQNSKV